MIRSSLVHALIVLVLSVPVAWCQVGLPWEKRLAHWAFQPVKPPVPAWSVDSLSTGESRSELSGVALTRRLGHRLLGLPPVEADLLPEAYTQEQLAALVDRYLASPHFGERWAQHWLDVVRYAESKGHEYDFFVQGAWRYRDYVVRAFNSDVPYDLLLKEHLMGDMLPQGRESPDGTPEGLLASIFWNLGESATSPTDLPNDEADRMENTLDTVGKAFQGLTVACARCHDHKADPIRQRDYYAMFGVAAGTPMDRAWANHAALQAGAAELQTLRDARDQKQSSSGGPEEWPALDPKGGQVLLDLAKTGPEALEAAGWSLNGWAEVVSPQLALGRGRAPGLWTGLLSKKLPARLRSPLFTIDSDYIHVLCAGKRSQIVVSPGNLQVIRDPIYQDLRTSVETGSQTWEWVRFTVGRWRGMSTRLEIFTGHAGQPLETQGSDEHHWGIRAVVAGNEADLPLPEGMAAYHNKAAWEKSEAMKAAEAKLPTAEYFLAVAEPKAGAAVKVHARGDAKKLLGEPVPLGYIAALQNNAAEAVKGSGRSGLAAALLQEQNPLTARVMVNRVWHHLFGEGLVPSCDDFGLLGEPCKNQPLLDALAWRFQHEYKWSVKALIRELVLSKTWQRQRTQPQRMDAESIRDAMLAVSGRLDATLGGPSVTALPRGNFFTNVIDVKEEGLPDGEGRRSIYLRVRRNTPDEFLTIFDRPAPVVSFGRRTQSQVPAQALALMNHPLPNTLAKYWGEAVAKEPGTTEEKLVRMHRKALLCDPAAERLAGLKALLEENPPSPADWAAVGHALFNLKEFTHLE
jgi:hypothetical protein